MLQRLEAEQTQRLIEALLYASQRVMNDQDGRAYINRLERQAAGNERRERAPKITLGFAQLLGAQIKGAPEEATKPPRKRSTRRKGGEQTA